MLNKFLKLPIDDIIPNIIESLKEYNSIILQATPGAGKTTRIPPALINLFNGKILVLEPRKLATKLSAERVAYELGEKCGETIGYQVRYDRIESKITKVKYITEGIFSRIILSDHSLKEVSCIILDEFHERHIHTDIALMLVKLLQETIRPDLKLIVMSATLETENLQKYLSNAKIFTSVGRSYPVKIEYIKPENLNKDLTFQVYNAIEYLLNNIDCPGNILVFLPGNREIKRCANTILELCNKFNCEVFQLKADLSPQEQQKIFSNSSNRKVILSTNVAETSITIDGITGVIDSGLAKIAGHASWSGLPTLDVLPISQSSCIQRAGRAGRTCPGIAIRLFSQLNFNMRPSFQKPEIHRIDLSQTLLELKVIENAMQDYFYSNNIKNNFDNFFPWFEKPSQNMIDSSLLLLRYLNAIDLHQNITNVGMQISKFPIHPRLGCILVAAKEKKLFPQAILIIAIIHEGMLLRKGIEIKDFGNSDIEYQLEIFKALYLKNTLTQSKKELVDFISFKRIETFAKQLSSICSISFQKCFEEISYNDLSLILLAGYPDRVSQVRNQSKKNINNRKEINLCLGGGAILMNSSVVHDYEFLLAIDAEESALALSQSSSTQIRICHGIDAELLISAPESFIQQHEEYIWDTESERVRGTIKTRYGKLILEEKPIREQTTEYEIHLIKQLTTCWPKPFNNDSALQYLMVKVNLAKQHGYKLNIPNFLSDDFELLLYHICEGKKSYKEILEKDLDNYIEELLDFEDKKLINELFPKYIQIGKGKKIQVHYEEGKSPWIASKLQDFYGTLKTPHICNGTIPLVVHLLAPNMQSVQVTTNLQGFWEKGYLEVKNELSRKYPRHAWPDNPKTAEPQFFIPRKKNT